MAIFDLNGFRLARLSAKMTQAQAAAAIGVDPLTIIQWEKGSNAPNRRNLAKAAEVYGVSEDYLLRGAADGQSAAQT